MTASKTFLAFLCACGIFVFIPQVSAETDCQTVQSIETLNKGVLSQRVAHLKGQNARLFVSLDPVWSLPEFDDVPNRHPDDMQMIREEYADLMKQGIDELVIWEFQRPAGLAVAIPFAHDCAVSGYGEPDELEKLVFMHELVLLISEQGLDDSKVRDGIKKLLMNSGVESHYDDKMVDIMIDKLRPLMIDTKSSTNND